MTAGVLLAAMLFPVFGGVGLASNRATDTVNEMSGELAKADPPMVTTILDKDGGLVAYLYDQYRIPVSSAQISNTMKAAIVAVEDKRFYEHHGVDWHGIARAAAKAGVEDQATEGASTLTQQYVKNYLAYVVGDADQDAYAQATAHTVARKLREARIALQLEQRESKDEILTGYLNVVPFGNKTYGVAAAARTYFNTTPDKLTVPQAALLAGLVNRPSALNPGKSPEEALARRNMVIDRMRENGAFGNPADASARQIAEDYKKAPLGVVSPLSVPASDCVGIGEGAKDGFFCRYVEEYLAKAGLPTDQLKRGGYTIRTTLDRHATDVAKQAAESQVPKTTKGIANVMSIVEPGTDKHRVRALVANRDYGNNASAGQTSYDLPAQMIPFGAGSIHKIFTSAAALEQGHRISDILPTPYLYTSSVFKGGGSSCPSAGYGEHWYCLHNASPNYPPQMTLQDALATSPNSGFVWLEEKVGVPAAVDMAVRLGMRSLATTKDPERTGKTIADAVKSENRASFTLGPTPTNVLELSNVAATLMSGGVWCPPTPIEQVLDRNGKPVPIREQGCQQVLSTPIANSLVVGLSKDDQGPGTSAAAAAAAGWNRPVMAKTGTTQEYKSAGFLAATPQLAGAVLTFADGSAPRPICDTDPPSLCGEGNIYGGKVPARTWYQTMNTLLAGQPVLPLPPVDPRYQ
ncbi:transglycosylase domain-containing protein [Gandjariella thermophila]|uniref:transglycosylase domain-containing protein n=1 Tax=Gandjariella thermophila TaxID=1931992 RepID=UPI001CEF837C|nr:transglycosylase domain-containing protein [Gandjariella thermophila]